MKRSTKNRIKSIIRSVVDPSANNYLESRERFSNAPYSISVYEDILNQANGNARIENHPFANRKASKECINLYIRHDIDSLRCIQNIDLLLNVNLKLNIPAGVYFRVDDDEYTLDDFKAVAQQCKSQGFETGLHTVCYAEDDYMKLFKLETEKFADEAGFRPTTFTIHGLGEYRLDVRKRFISEIIDRHDEFGYSFSDCHKAFRAYHHVIEDCHMDAELNQRYIFDDFREFPNFFKLGLNYLILTHPCYWEEDKSGNALS